MHSTSIRVDATKILSPRELAALLYDLHRKAPRSANTWLNLILVRLSCCCGLRVSEIAGLRINDIRVEPSRPHIRIAVVPRRAVALAWFRCGGIPARWLIWRNGRPNGCDWVP